MKKVLLLVVVILAGQSFKAQLAVSNTAPYNNVTYLVNNVLLGQNVTASNITFNGDPNQIGFFSNGLPGATNPLGIDSGIVISSGNVNDIPNGGNQPSTDFSNPGDPDLLTIAQSVNPVITSSDDAAALEFDFIPLGDTVEFRFSFASDEYLSWINTNFNDIFAFFISGPGFAGPYAAPTGFTAGAENLAFVPGTITPITISTIYNDPNQTPTQVNGQYYINNPNENTFEFNGYTTVISIKFNVTCNALYHFKFAVSDCGDGTLDTGVLMEGSSFTSIPPIGIQFSTVTGDSTIIEGCAPAKLNFIRSDTAGDLTLHYIIGGTATNGVDYTTIADSVSYLSGIDTASITIIPLIDIPLEGSESITITATSVNSCSNIITSTGTMYINDLPNLVTNSSNVNLPCPETNVPLKVFANGAATPYIYEWTNTQGNVLGTTDSINVSGMQTDTFYVSTSDSCELVTIFDTIIVNMHILPLQLSSIDDAILCPGEQILLIAQPSQGLIPYNLTWNPGSTNQSNGASIVVTPVGTDTITFSLTDACLNTILDTIIIDASYTPMTIDIPTTELTCSGTPLEISGNISGGRPNYSFNWTDGVISFTDVTFLYPTNTPIAKTLSLTVTDFCENEISGSIDIEVIVCEVNISTAITPNGDGMNDFLVFENLHHFPNNRLTVLNRWGEILLEKDNYQNDWDGENSSQGTYFYVLELNNTIRTIHKGTFTLLK